ncbi:predicted protein [Uncinocarpus reesii 1704]|uniref:Uncharacterized protein n=1 Tax=Uncinocarpus reesii (strain UAMH 1704) TaxID=336963 RepID=C4JMU6_UNCRE|nr:uncharacterized protein UREG_04154 [Uncinocarpus reesii 1704]EEP79308.1 predicted protein [Uncinocarpus reesii 1704]
MATAIPFFSAYAPLFPASFHTTGATIDDWYEAVSVTLPRSPVARSHQREHQSVQRCLDFSRVDIWKSLVATRLHQVESDRIRPIISGEQHKEEDRAVNPTLFNTRGFSLGFTPTLSVYWNICTTWSNNGRRYLANHTGLNLEFLNSQSLVAHIEILLARQDLGGCITNSCYESADRGWAKSRLFGPYGALERRHRKAPVLASKYRTYTSQDDSTDDLPNNGIGVTSCKSPLVDQARSVGPNHNWRRHDALSLRPLRASYSHVTSMYVHNRVIPITKSVTEFTSPEDLSPDR